MVGIQTDGRAADTTQSSNQNHVWLQKKKQGEENCDEELVVMWGMSYDNHYTLFNRRLTAKHTLLCVVFIWFRVPKKGRCLDVFKAETI